MVVQQSHSTRALVHGQKRDPGCVADADRNGPGEPAPPGRQQLGGQMPALLNPSLVVFLLVQLTTSTYHQMSTSSSPFFNRLLRICYSATEQLLRSIISASSCLKIASHNQRLLWGSVGGFSDIESRREEEWSVGI